MPSIIDGWVYFGGRETIANHNAQKSGGAANVSHLPTPVAQGSSLRFNSGYRTETFLTGKSLV